MSPRQLPVVGTLPGVARSVGAAHSPTGRTLANKRKPVALAVVVAIYAVAAACAAGVATATAGGRHPITRAAVADIVATVVVFAGSMAVANSSMYDAYWSVIPPIVAVYWWTQGPSSVAGGVQARHVVVVALVVAWAVRLTLNWASGWPGMSHEDWRYVDMRTNTQGRAPWPLVSFAGVHLFPTVQVFLGMLALWPALAGGRRSFSVIDVVAVIVTAGAILIELIADLQLHRFTRDAANRGHVMTKGLWAHSRHPNYFGEIAFWWGLWLFGLAADQSWWWTVIGPVTLTAMFVFASVPMLDRRSLQRRPGYAEQMDTLRAIIPLPRRSRRRLPTQR